MSSLKSIDIVGSLNIDLVTVTPRVPGPGETLTASSFSTGFGGKGANQAVACARLLRHAARGPPADGIQVRMVGAVGDDQFGLDFRAHLEREGLQLDAIQTRKDMKTGTAVILVEEQTGENRILFTPGANGAMKAGDTAAAETPGGVVIFQLELPLSTVLESLRKCKQQGKLVILNPAPAVPLPDEAYDSLDHLILNESEASILSNIPEEQLSNDFERLAAYFHDRGVKTLVVTLGSKGVVWRSIQHARSSTHDGFVPAHKVAAVDTTAAGDCFVGAYAVWLTKNSSTDIEAAVRFANRAASLAVQKYGAQSSIPFFGEIEEL